MLETDYMIDRLLWLEGEQLSARERDFLERVRGHWLTRDQRRKIGEIAERVRLGVAERA